MEARQARDEIRKIATQRFDPKTFTPFIHNLLNDVEHRDNEYRGNTLVDAYREHITQYQRIGKYTDPNGTELDILIIEVRDQSKLVQTRTTLRNFVVRHLKKFGEKEHALAAFYAKEDGGADWRFSYIKIEHEAYQDESGKAKTREDLTPARRYSFLVGEHENSHTAQNQLLPLLERDYANPTVEEIEQAFSVEKVTDEFFEKYKALYLGLHEHIQKDETAQTVLAASGLDAERFSKKLLGQIVFLYFLQKKGWIGVAQNDNWGQGDRKFLRTLYERAEEAGKNYYLDYLQYLFYEALAVPNSGFDSAYYRRFACKIPFLNGGLFEADYDWKNQLLTLPDHLFHNTEKTKDDVGTGILDVFDRYNFTIKEDEPLEKEVAVDPEMLGKVFENMLEVSERKGKGAYYTPREIVHYMCRESLILYLENGVNTEEKTLCPKEDLEWLVRDGLLILENDRRVAAKGRETADYYYLMPESIRDNAALLDKKLAAIKICDPAIGSGAFPVGLMHEIVTARQVLQTYAPTDDTTYKFKRHAIENSIYGVDIDAGAIDIARLRLWLSLVVEEDNPLDIDPLPNLDYKIIRGNSLIGFPEGVNTYGLDEIEALKATFFAETDHDRKAALKKDIDKKLQKRFENSESAFDYIIEFDFKYLFSEVWHDRDGFDVVIGNPPYVQIQKMSGTQVQKDLAKQTYKSFVKTGDLYCLFYEKGYRILRDGGVLTMITSNKWMRAGYGEKMRRFFLSEGRIDQLIDFGDSPIFKEATTYTNIMIFLKTHTAHDPIAWDVNEVYQDDASLDAMLSDATAGAGIFSPEGFLITTPDQARIKERVETVGTPLNDWDVTLCRGVTTGLNDAFVLSNNKRDLLVDEDPKNSEIIKPILRGRDIKRYKITYSMLWLIVVQNGFYKILEDQYPTIVDHLKIYENDLKARGQCRYTSSRKIKADADFPGQHHWLELDNNPKESYVNEFAKDKILWLEMSPIPNFTFSADEIFVLNTAYIMTGQALKYMLAVLNSSILNVYFPMISADVRGKTRRYTKQYVEKLPVPEITDPQRPFFEHLVDYTLFTKKADLTLPSAYFEQLLDGMVFELYFPDELKAAGKDLLAHIGDLEPITDEMSDEQKLALIQRTFDRLYDPSHPVRNRLETLDSVEEVRIVREALK